MTEQTLLRQSVRGDGEALERLVALHQTPLLRYATRLTGSVETAQDAVQETFLRLVRAARELSRSPSIVPWLFRVCRNQCADRARKESRMLRRHQRVAVPTAVDPELPEMELAEDRITVTSLLQELPEADREVLLLKVQHDRSYREIAAITGLSLHHVSAAMHRGLQRMAARLRDAGLG